MTSNPRFAQYVERVQENLAVFSLSDEKAKTFLRESDSIARYDPSFVVFEILVNEKVSDDDYPVRVFDPHVSSKLLEGFTLESCSYALERLDANADFLEAIRKRPVNWESIDWSLPEDSEGEFLNLKNEVAELFEIHNKLRGEHTHEKRLNELKRQMPEVNIRENHDDLEKVTKTLRKLVKRYEREYIPTNLSASALIYEAWKLGRLQPLGNPEGDQATFDSLLDALFVYEEKGIEGDPLSKMAQNIGIPYLNEVGKSRLDNGETWLRVPKKPWVACVESALVHGRLITETPPDTYTIHFPLIIDNYRFVGFCYLSTAVEQGQIPAEIFESSKYSKFYCIIQAVSETLRLSLRADALDNIERCLNRNQYDPDEIFSEVVKDYFVCFDVIRDNEAPSQNSIASRDSLNTKVLYHGHGIKIYGPNWVTADHKRIMHEELDGQVEKHAFNAVPGLYQDVIDRIEQFKLEKEQARLRGKEDQAGVFSHQAAGLVAEVWCDPGMAKLRPQSQGCLWQLKTLIDIWGNFDLEPDTFLNQGPQDFPDPWTKLSGKELLDELINTAIVHSLRRATYRRSGKSSGIDKVTRKKALEIRKSSDRIGLFKDWIGLQISDSCHGIYPKWMSYRGFVLCFHHCFWQSAFHGFCARSNPSADPQDCFVHVDISEDSVTISNQKGGGLFDANSSFSPRDIVFYEENLLRRIKGSFEIDGPKPVAGSKQTWQVTIAFTRIPEAT